MNNEQEQEFGEMLSSEQIDLEISKVAAFFKRIPDELKAVASIHLILEIVNQGSRDYFQALGLFDEAKTSFREMALSIGEGNDEDDLLSKAFENSQQFRCTCELKYDQDRAITPGEICTIGFMGKDDRYSGGERYEVFQEDGQHFSICQESLEEHFEEADDIN